MTSPTLWASNVVKAAGGHIGRWWTHTWHNDTDPFPLAALRTLVGLVTAGWAASRISTADWWLATADAAGQPEGVSALLNHPTVAVAAVAALLLMGLSTAAGFRTRWAAISAAALLWLITAASPVVFNSGDRLLLLLNLIVACSAPLPWAVDSRRQDASQQKHVPVWPLRLLQLQMSLMYAGAAISKLQVQVWRDGTALAGVWQLETLARSDLGMQLAEFPWVAAGATWGTLAVELTLAAAIWLPWKRVRWAVLAAGVVMHVFIDVMMVVGWFSLVSLSVYPALAGAPGLRLQSPRTADGPLSGEGDAEG